MEKNDFMQLKVLLNFWINLLTSLAPNRESLRSVRDRLLSGTHMTLTKPMTTEGCTVFAFQDSGIFLSYTFSSSHIGKELIPGEIKQEL